MLVLHGMDVRDADCKRTGSNHDDDRGGGLCSGRFGPGFGSQAGVHLRLLGLARLPGKPPSVLAFVRQSGELQPFPYLAAESG